MVDLLTLDGIAETGGKSAWLQIVRTMKEKLCYVALDVAADKAKAADSSEI
jgi:hypothetical protein